MDTPERLKLVLSTPAGDGNTMGWDEAGNPKLGPPILEFKTDDLLNDELVGQYRDVLTFWVQCDQTNVRRHQMGLRSARLPPKYKTNEVPRQGAFAKYFLNYGTPDIRAKAEENVLELDEWLGPLMLRDGDRVGALLAALRTRHSDPDYAQQRGSNLAMELRAGSSLDANMVTPGPDYVFAPYDALLTKLRQKLGD